MLTSNSTTVASVFLGNSETGEFLACIGVDAQSSRSAPFGKGIRVNVDFLYSHTLTFDTAIELLCRCQPIIVSFMKLMGINEDRFNLRPVVPAKPSNSNDLDLVRTHRCHPFGCVTAPKVPPAGRI